MEECAACTVGNFLAAGWMWGIRTIRYPLSAIRFARSGIIPGWISPPSFPNASHPEAHPAP
jgi:hypothetical protein